MLPSDLERIGSQRIGKGLRDRRIALGWSQRHLARVTGINQSTISRVEAGRFRYLSLWYVATMWEALGIEAPWFPRLGAADAADRFAMGAWEPGLDRGTPDDRPPRTADAADCITG